MRLSKLPTLPQGAVLPRMLFNRMYGVGGAGILTGTAAFNGARNAACIA